ncbi:MAG: peptide-methionine (S)-S-oxide reductase MsrA [Pyrinomonadaceae bacterium]
MNRVFIYFLVAVLTGMLVSCSVRTAAENPLLPTPSEPRAEIPQVKGEQIAVFAGGCFWGVEAVFEHVKGVMDVRSGYAGGDARTANYEKVSEGSTGHAEAVMVTFDPAKVSFAQLLTVFFSVAHDPTQLNRQGPDTGTQYRSAIFFADEQQERAVIDYIGSIDRSKAFARPVVTEVIPLKRFFEAEAYHQNYLINHPDEPYIVVHDIPKLEELKKRFPELYAAK